MGPPVLPGGGFPFALGGVGVLPGGFRAGLLDKGRQGEEEDHQGGQKQEPLHSVAQTTEPLQAEPHGGGRGPQEAPACPGAPGPLPLPWRGRAESAVSAGKEEPRHGFMKA